MGNAVSVSTQNSFYTSCMAKYTCITKPQVMALRNLLVLLSQSKEKNKIPNGPMMIRRKHLQLALQKINLINVEPDSEIIDLIFTMWCGYSNNKDEDESDDVTNVEDDNNNNNNNNNKNTGVVLDQTTKKKNLNRAPWYEFLISISLLACKTDTFEQAIRFTLYVVHRNHYFNVNNNSSQGYISSKDAVLFIQGICTTASYFGDKIVLEHKEISNIVDTIYESLTMVTFERLDSESTSVQQKEILFDEFVKSLLQQKSIKDIVVVLSPKQKSILRNVNTKTIHVKPVKTITPVIHKSAMKQLSPSLNVYTKKDQEPNIKKYYTTAMSPRGNSNKYMPLIDEIEKDAKKLKRQQFTSKIVLTSLPSEEDDTIIISSSNDNDDDDDDVVDKAHINFSTTEEEDIDDETGEVNSLQDEEDDDTSDTENNHQKPTSILSKKLQNKSTKLNQKYTSHNPTNTATTTSIYSMLYETSTTVSPSSVTSTDLSSHMSSVMLTPLARIKVSSNNTHTSSHHHSTKSSLS